MGINSWRDPGSPAADLHLARSAPMKGYFRVSPDRADPFVTVSSLFQHLFGVFFLFLQMNKHALMLLIMGKKTHPFLINIPGWATEVTFSAEAGGF